MATSRRDFLRDGICTLGGLALASRIQDFGLVHALTPQSVTDYKALVCVFLNGGNDGNNMIVPLDAEFANYAAVRNPNANVQLGLLQSQILPINLPPSIPRQFGFHFNMPEMRDLFNQGKLAVLCNNGPLVEPITRITYQNGTGKKPLQLFSHSDQVGLFQTAIADSVSQTGWGGRLADRTATLNSPATFPQNVSIAGINLILTGVNTRQLAIGDSNTPLSAVLPLTMTGTTSEVTSRRTAFDALRGMDLNLTLIKAASDTRTSSMQTSAALASVNPTINTPFPNPSTSLSRQLLQVARLIKACTDPTAGINMKRQIFFVSIGGFDTHSNQRGAGQDTLLQQISQAMKAFYDATVELGVENKVTTFTMSDFGRTFQPAGSLNGVGSDHAWGNHSFIMGGAVHGGDFYGTFPTLALGGPDDTDGGSNPRGRWIPTTSVEQYAATLATWYGLAPSDLSLVFPLLSRFSPSNLGFMT